MTDLDRYTRVAEGVEAYIVYDAPGRRIGKIFKPRAHPDRGEIARREFDRLRLLHRELASVDLVSVPRPVALESDPPVIWMERATGLPMSVLLANRTDPPIEPAEIGGPLARGLTRCLDAIGEPYYDFCPQNVVCDPHEPSLSLVDFGIPRNLPDEVRNMDPLTVSLGTFLGWSLYDLSRPSRLAHLSTGHPYIRTLRAVLDHLDDRAEMNGVSPDGLSRTAYLTFRRLGSGGGRLRGYWYRLLACRWFTANQALSFAL